MRTQRHIQRGICRKRLHQRERTQTNPQRSKHHKLTTLAPLPECPRWGYTGIPNERHRNIQERRDATTDHGGCTDRQCGTNKTFEHQGRMEHDKGTQGGNSVKGKREKGKGTEQGS